jgi:hypothetical protein
MLFTWFSRVRPISLRHFKKWARKHCKEELAPYYRQPVQVHVTGFIDPSMVATLEASFRESAGHPERQG